MKKVKFLRLYDLKNVLLKIELYPEYNCQIRNVSEMTIAFGKNQIFYHYVDFLR